MDITKLKLIREEDDIEEEIEAEDDDGGVKDLSAKVEDLDVDDEEDEAMAEDDDEEEVEDEEWEEEEDDGTPSWLTEHTYVVRSTQEGFQPADGEALATVQLTTISRKEFKEVGEDFHAAMDDVSLEYSDFARAIFTPSLTFRPDLSTSGSKVFGNETGQGDIVCYLDEITVHPEYRRKGVGRWAVEQVLKSAVLEDCRFVYVLPAILSEAPDSDDEAEPSAPLRSPAETHALLEPLISFFHALGFRRLGTTDYLSLPLHQPSHPALSLPSSSDPPSSSAVFALLPPEEMSTSFPVHHLIRSTPLTPTHQLRLASSLRQLASTAPFLLDAPDPLGDTPLHVAAREGSAQAVTVLLGAQGGEREQRRARRNVAGMTAGDVAERGVRLVGPDGGRGAVLTLLRG